MHTYIPTRPQLSNQINSFSLAISEIMSSSKFLLNSTFFRTLMKSRRGYSTVAADNVKVVPSTTAAVRKNKTESGATGEKEEDQVYWMRDPKTGYWVPETHFGDVGVVELRERLLSKNYNNKQ